MQCGAQYPVPEARSLGDIEQRRFVEVHEIKFDGFRMHALFDRGAVRLLTRTGLDWTRKYPAIAAAVSALGARQAYLDGLCGVFPDGITSFSMIQAGSDAATPRGWCFFCSTFCISTATTSPRGR
jgi:ATP-dependent DNA ligase